MKFNPFGPEYMENTYPKRIATHESVQKAIENSFILESLVVSCDNDLELTVSLGKDMIGKIPFKEIEYKTDGTESKPIVAMSRVGRHVKFIPTSMEYDKQCEKWIVQCSRKEAQKRCYEEVISKLIPGDIIDARIVKIENYGAFCDIGCGIIALLPTNLISVTHVTNPKQLLGNMSNLKVVVKDIQPDGKIQLTHRELLGTWKEEASKLKVGNIVCGTVLSIEEYGVFVRLSQNLSGLAEPTDDLDLKTGDVVSVRINTIIERKMKVKLSVVSKIENCEEMIKFKYYKTNGHIDEWIYSPEGKRCIKTVFSRQDNKN